MHRDLDMRKATIYLDEEKKQICTVKKGTRAQFEYTEFEGLEEQWKTCQLIVLVDMELRR